MHKHQYLFHDEVDQDADLKQIQSWTERDDGGDGGEKQAGMREKEMEDQTAWFHVTSKKRWEKRRQETKGKQETDMKRVMDRIQQNMEEETQAGLTVIQKADMSPRDTNKYGDRSRPIYDIYSQWRQWRGIVPKILMEMREDFNQMIWWCCCCLG